MKIRYQVKARDWDEGLQRRFGSEGGVHELTYGEVVECIIMFGRASVGWNDLNKVYILDFENTYD